MHTRRTGFELQDGFSAENALGAEGERKNRKDGVFVGDGEVMDHYRNSKWDAQL